MAEPSERGNPPRPRSSEGNSVTVLCPECQEIIEIADVEGLVRALHLQNECVVSNLFHHNEA